MRKDPKGGVMADYSLSNVAKKVAGTITANLETMRNWAEREYGNNTTIFGKGSSNGHIYAINEIGSHSFQAMDYSKSAGWARGLAVDPYGELVYTGKRYLGRTVTSVLDGALAAAANTVDVVDVGAAPTAGYAFIVGNFTGNMEVIQYTGITTNQLTGVTRGKLNSTDQDHSTAKEIIFFDDDWQDLGADQQYDRRPIFIVEDWTLVGNVNTVAGYKESNFSDYSVALLTLPAGYEIVDFSSILTGAGIRVLVAADIENRATIFVWDPNAGDEW